MHFQLSASVRVDRDTSTFDLALARVAKFFSNSFFVYRFCSHLAYFLGICFEYIGYHYERAYPVKNF